MSASGPVTDAIIAFQANSHVSPILGDFSTAELAEEMGLAAPIRVGVTQFFPKYAARNVTTEVPLIAADGLVISLKAFFFAVCPGDVFFGAGRFDVSMALSVEVRSESTSAITQEHLDRVVGRAIGPASERPRTLPVLLASLGEGLAESFEAASDIWFATGLLERSAAVIPTRHIELAAIYLNHAGQMVSRHELLLNRISLKVESKAELKAALRTIGNLRTFAVELKRYFLTRSQSADPAVRSLFELLIQRHRMRERLADQVDILEQIENITTNRIRELNIEAVEYSQQFFSVAAVVGVVLGTFFGLFQMSSKAEIVKAALPLTTDSAVVGLFVVVALSIITLALLLAAALKRMMR